MGIRSFRDLRVWQGAMDLIDHTYRLTRAFPSEEAYCLVPQMRRAAISVASNIAEGHTREHTKEYLHHLSMAQASLAELETQIEVAGRQGYLSGDRLAKPLDEAQALGRQLYALRNSLLKPP